MRACARVVPGDAHRSAVTSAIKLAAFKQLRLLPANFRFSLRRLLFLNSKLLKQPRGGGSQHLPMCISINGRDNHTTDKNTFVRGIDLMIKSGKCKVIARFYSGII